MEWHHRRPSGLAPVVTAVAQCLVLRGAKDFVSWEHGTHENRELANDRCSDALEGESSLKAHVDGQEHGSAVWSELEEADRKDLLGAPRLAHKWQGHVRIRWIP